MMEIIWNWQPKVGLGPFILGTLIDTYRKNYSFVLASDEVEDRTNWVGYKITGVDTFIDVEDGSIESISSSEYFCFKGDNLIGLTFNELNKKLPNAIHGIGEPVEYDDGDVQISYDYDELGLIIWVSNDIVVNATCINL